MRSRSILKLVAPAAFLAAIAAPTAVAMSDGLSSTTQAQCYNGVPVLNPYAQSCTLPGPVNRTRGAAPDANAIIACRHHPGCLAYYVNGP